MLWIPNQLEGARLGSTTVLECNTEAFPRSINYWTNHKGEMIAAAGSKYDTMTKEDTYKTYMRLVIHNVTREDFNTYRCIAKNSLGETDGSIKLYVSHKSVSNQSVIGQSSVISQSSTISQPSIMSVIGPVISHKSVINHKSAIAHNHQVSHSSVQSSAQSINHKSESSIIVERSSNHVRSVIGQSSIISPNSWRTGDAVNEILSDVDEMFREKEQSHGKDPGYGRETSSSSFDHSFTFDSGASWTRSLGLMMHLKAEDAGSEAFLKTQRGSAVHETSRSGGGRDASEGGRPGPAPITALSV
nr:contactin-6-like [Penaeus vannamei]